ncbi:MAG: nucleotide-binding universal stress UspA family protein [Myxococcota bacterium]|jgi:nucleotide-binding universal stress UspA family protein
MSILLPVDVSAPNLIALPYAIALAGALSTSIVVFHVAPCPPPLWMLETLHRLSDSIKKAGLTHHIRVREGDPAPTICTEAVLRDCSWIVLGAGLVPLGPVAGLVIGLSTVPTLAVSADGRLRLCSTHQADQLCSLLHTRGTVTQQGGHVVLSLAHHPLERAI